MMDLAQILSGAAAVASFTAHIVVASSMTRTVNDRLGTDYKGIWSSHGDEVWKEHQRLFPASRKRAALAATLVAAFALFMATAFLAR